MTDQEMKIKVLHPISTAPKGVEILGWRKDCGFFLAKYTSLDDFLSESEIENYNEDELFKDDWFYSDISSHGRLEGDEIPTHWYPLPDQDTPKSGQDIMGKVKAIRDKKDCMVHVTQNYYAYGSDCDNQTEINYSYYSEDSDVMLRDLTREALVSHLDGILNNLRPKD